MRGSPTASIVEFRGTSSPASATVVSTARSPGGDGGALAHDADDARITADLEEVAVDLEERPVADRRRGQAGADDGGDGVLARDDGAVAEDPSGVGDHGRGD